MPIRLNGSTSGYSQLDAPAIAGDQLFTLPGAGGTLDRLNRAGNVLQVVQAATSTQATSTSTTYADTGLTASITPASATSKILVLVNQASCGKAGSDMAVQVRLMRGATEIAAGTGGYTATSVNNFFGSLVLEYLDSPASTSSLTYKTQFRIDGTPAGGLVYVNSGASLSTITLMEIAA